MTTTPAYNASIAMAVLLTGKPFARTILASLKPLPPSPRTGHSWHGVADRVRGPIGSNLQRPRLGDSLVYSGVTNGSDLAGLRGVARVKRS